MRHRQVTPHQPKPVEGNGAEAQPKVVESSGVEAQGQGRCTTCSFCGDKFPTRSNMFRHLERPSNTCSAPRKDMGEKVFLILGYDCSLMREVAAGAGGGEAGEAAAVGGQRAATLVLKAMGIQQRGSGGGGRGDDDNVSSCPGRPHGFSQASSVGSRTCPLLAQEPEVSATADTLCLKAPVTVPADGVRAWLDETNAAIDSEFKEKGAVRLLGRMIVPPTFHAEISAKRRRYEYLIPAWMLDDTAQGPWPEGGRSQEKLIPLLRRLRGKGFKPFGHCSGDNAGRRRRCPLWHNFSTGALPHSPSSFRRLYRFFAMEVFQSPRAGEVGAGGGDFVCLSINGDAFLSQQVRGMVALAVAGARGVVSASDIAACIDPARQDDMLPVPLAPGSPCWLAEVGYPSWQSRLGVAGTNLCMSPGAEQRACLPREGWSDEGSRRRAVEFRRGILGSAARWWEESGRGGGAGWLRDVLVPGALRLRGEIAAANRRAGAAVAPSTASGGDGSGESSSGGGDNGNGDGWRDGSKGESRYDADGARRLPVEGIASLEEAPALYEKVLKLLREANASGFWPYSSASRSQVILGDKAEKAIEAVGGNDSGFAHSQRPESVGGGAGESFDDGGRAAAAVSAVRIPNANDDEKGLSIEHDGQQRGSRLHQQQQQQEQQEQQQHGNGRRWSGSFTLGFFPPPCPPPRGNRLFPVLARAAFELEAALLPGRPPSTTIAVNRNAQFKPHVDSGAGAGQSTSLIVGLGDYAGGELVVEGEEVDIRYRPLEFNGWTQRHWTRPFEGERYSLVWFTPKGCEGIAGDARFLTSAAVPANFVEGAEGAQ